ncbi:MAG: hypothetical protein R3C25_05425 [Hyphomonadaceae bacterium]
MLRFVRISALAALATLLAASASAQNAAIPAMLMQAIAATQAAKADYAFDFELTSADASWRARFEPGATPRLRLVAPNRDELANDQRRAFDRMAEEFEGVSWCAGEGMGQVRDVRLLREDDATVTYSFQPTRESVRGAQARNFADRMRGEVTLTKDNPDITRLRIYTPSPVSPMPLVRIDRFNLTISCQTAPNGRRYAADTVAEIHGSAFGQALDERTTQRARNLQ